VGLDQSQGQLGQFADQLFEAAVFLSPLLGLGNQIHRDVSGVGFGLNLPGQIVAQMLFASGTAAVGIAASATDSDEAGGQDGAFGLELFLAGLKEAVDQGGVFRNFHTFTRAILEARLLNSIKAYQLQALNRALRQLFWETWPASSPEPQQRSQISQAGKIKEDENPGHYWCKCDQNAVLGHQKSLALDYSNAVVKVRNPAMLRGWQLPQLARLEPLDRYQRACNWVQERL
jgi:hypothetical protein